MFLNEYAGILNGPPGLGAAPQDTLTTVNNLYHSIVKRDPLQGERDYWVNMFGGTMTDADIATVTNNLQKEATNPVLLKRTEGNIISFFTNTLMRQPTQDEIDYWDYVFGPNFNLQDQQQLTAAYDAEITEIQKEQNRLQSGEPNQAAIQAQTNLVAQWNDFYGKNPKNANDVFNTSQLVKDGYPLFFRRDATQNDIDHWVSVLGPMTNQRGWGQIENEFAVERIQPQNQQKMQTAIADLFAKILKREPDTDERNYWILDFGPTLEQSDIDRFTLYATSELVNKSNSAKRTTLPQVLQYKLAKQDAIDKQKLIDAAKTIQAKEAVKPTDTTTLVEIANANNAAVQSGEIVPKTVTATTSNLSPLLLLASAAFLLGKI